MNQTKKTENDEQTTKSQQHMKRLRKQEKTTETYKKTEYICPDNLRQCGIPYSEISKHISRHFMQK